MVANLVSHSDFNCRVSHGMAIFDVSRCSLIGEELLYWAIILARRVRNKGCGTGGIDGQLNVLGSR